MLTHAVTMTNAPSVPSRGLPDRIGRFPVLRKLGEGGMGVVYAARDDRLGRDVAVKVMRHGEEDRAATARLMREARAAAGVGHPSFCQIFEIDEDAGRPFLVMELLSGESLATRIATGPMTPREAVGIAVDLLAALDALHTHGLIHRDLKPSNVFLTPHGIKLLDFGLARPLETGDETIVGLTLPGMLVGSPHYMSPEQARGLAVDARTDLFAMGVVLFEMLTGHPPFGGASVIEVLHAVLDEHPPALTGSPGIVGVDRVIHRALAKQPERRYASAREMGADLRAVATLAGTSDVARAVTVTRVAVLPFRLLKPDSEVDYLGYGLADAITGSLAGLQSLVVRSSLATARYGSEPQIDVRRVAGELDVDLLLSGTLLRAGDRLRVSVELVEATTGKAAWTQVSQVALDDVFQLQDELARRIVSALPLTVDDRARMRSRDVPADDGAYELYLKGNRFAAESSTWRLARELYEQCVARDPAFAPAWAGLGRVRRVLGKYNTNEDPATALSGAEEALRRALDLNPDLSGAHLYYAQLETDLGRAEESMVRLLRRARTGRAEPEILAGLVHTCRYCGLLDASIAAHELASRLDPAVKTSVLYSYWAAGRYQRALDESEHSVDSFDCVILESMGRHDEARAAAVREEERYSTHAHARIFYSAMRALLENRIDDCRRFNGAVEHARITDGEAIYFLARMWARLGDTARALDLLGRCIAQGFTCAPLFERDPWLAALRNDTRFAPLQVAAQEQCRTAAARFQLEGGATVLGIGSPS